MPLQKYMIEHLLYPAMEHRKGNQIRSILSELQFSQNANIEQIQRTRLINLLLHCKKHVPAYANVLPNASIIQADPFAVLHTQVPLLPKRQFQRTAQQHLADNIPDTERITNCTGGSTGEPIHFYMTRRQVESYEAARWRGLSWYGITQGSRSVMLWGSPIELSKQAQLKNRLRESLLKNRRILSAYNLTERDLAKHILFLERYKPEYLYGYATILTAFAQMLDKHRIHPNLTLKAVVSTSETLEPWQAELLEKVFRCPVANEYGARDAGILAYTCPQGGIHITAENCIIEVLDPVTHEPLPDGQSGLLAITDLTNFVQPRLRYLLGDIGTISPSLCRCGRTLPLLLHIDGREDDLLIGHDGTLVHGNIIGQLLRPLNGLAAFQFRQHTPLSATLYLVKTIPTLPLNEQSIHEQLAKVLPDTEVTIRYVSQITPTASGKLRYAIRECPLPMEACHV